LRRFLYKLMPHMNPARPLDGIGCVPSRCPATQPPRHCEKSVIIPLDEILGPDTLSVGLGGNVAIRLTHPTSISSNRSPPTRASTCCSIAVLLPRVPRVPRGAPSLSADEGRQPAVRLAGRGPPVPTSPTHAGAGP